MILYPYLPYPSITGGRISPFFVVFSGMSWGTAVDWSNGLLSTAPRMPDHERPYLPTGHP